EHPGDATNVALVQRHGDQPAHYPSSARSPGERRCQSVADWYACPTRNTSASACRAPTICSPIGSAADVNPHGTLSAGCWVRLNGYEYGVQLVQSGECQSSGTSLPGGNAGSGSVGVTSTS